MRTQAEIEASRKNGSKSNGPNSESGKTRSSQNSLKHGFFSVKTVVLDGESKQEWEVYREAWFARLKPRDFIEERLVLEIAVNQWRLERAWNLRTALIDQETCNQREIIPEAYEQYDETLILSCSHAARKDDLLALDQHETRLSRNGDRAYRKLNDIRAQYPIDPILENDPEPEPESIESENEPGNPDQMDGHSGKPLPITHVTTSESHAPSKLSDANAHGINNLFLSTTKKARLLVSIFLLRAARKRSVSSQNCRSHIPGQWNPHAR